MRIEFEGEFEGKRERGTGQISRTKPQKTEFGAGAEGARTVSAEVTVELYRIASVSSNR